MTQRTRSPVLGYNHNLRRGGRVYHVQTEDSGPAYARVYTHLFFEGTILASKKQQYEPAASEDAVRLIMQQLHKAMIRELAHGGHDPHITGFFAARGLPAMLELPVAPALAPELQPPVGIVMPPAHPMPVAVAAGPAVARPASAPAALGATGTPNPVGTPGPSVRTPAPRPKPVVVVNPGGLKRPPVVLSSSADGVVVRRNVVINVGGGAAPVNGSAPAGAEPALESAVQPLGSAREIHMPWDASRAPAPRVPASAGPPPLPPAARSADAATATEGSAKGPRQIRMPWDPPAPAPTEVFVADVGNDKSLDEVILEYLSDDPETEPR